MSVFCPIVYFFPGCSGVASIPKAERSFTSGNPHSRNVTGPDGKTGLLISPHSAPGGVRYCADSQNWQKLTGYWVGVEKNPRFEALIRPQVVKGEFVEVKNTRVLIPRANPVTHSCTLSKVLDLDVEGNWYETVSEEYAELSEFALKLAEELAQSLMDDGEPSLPADDLQHVLAFVCRIIRVNYDLTDREIARLGLVRAESYFEILATFADLVEYARYLAGAGTDSAIPFGLPVSSGTECSEKGSPSGDLPRQP